MNRNIKITAVVLVALLVGLLSYKYVINPDSSITTDRDKQTDTKPTKADIRFKDRETMRYSLENETIVIPTKSNMFFKKIKIGVESTLEVVVFRDKGEIYLAMQFDKFDFIVEQSQKTQKARADDELFEPLLIKLSDGATIDSILFSYKLSKKQQKQISGLLDTLQIAFRADTKSWSNTEQNSNGSYGSRYSVELSNTKTHITKESIKYTSIKSPESTIEIKKSTISATADSSSWISKLSYLQEEIYGARGKVMMSSKVTTKLHRLEPIDTQMILSRFANISKLRKYLTAGKFKPKETAIDKLSPKDAIRSFFSCMEGGKCNFLDIQRELKNYLVAHPDSYYIVLDLIKDDKYKKFHHRLINMLRDLGTPEAQSAMIDIIKGKDFSQSNRTQSAMSIGFLHNPTVETIESLKQLTKSSLLEEQQQIATYYALGNLASLSPQMYELISPDLIKDLETSNSPSEIVTALGALENTENNDIIDHVKPYLEDNNAAIRRGAAEALRLTPSPDATKALHEQLQHEDYDLVINAIAFSLHHKKDLTPDIIRDVAVKSANHIKKSNDTMMRKSVDFLVDKSKKNPDAKNALMKMMGKNLSIEVKNRIIRGL